MFETLIKRSQANESKYGGNLSIMVLYNGLKLDSRGRICSGVEVLS